MNRVYIETAIPSFYYEGRTEPEMVAMRNWTRKWWQQYSPEFELVTSEAVINELEKGEYPHKTEMLSLVDPLEIVAVEPEIAEIIEYYLAHRLMPQNTTGDALHLALASFHKCDYLLTWNCRHLANPNKFHHIQIANTALGLFVPILATPMAMLGEENE